MPPRSLPSLKPASHVPAFALLAVLVALAYGNSLENGFTFDDEHIIVRNPLIKRVAHLPALLTNDYWAGIRDPAAAPYVHTGLYRPLVLLSYAATYAVAGLTPAAYHLINVLLHGAVVWLIFLLALQLGLSLRPATVAAALFALHPIHTEAVSGIVGRAELMMAIGVLASLVWAIRGRRILSLIAFAFGLLAKEQAVMLPILVALYDACLAAPVSAALVPRINLRQALARYGGYGLVLLGYGLVRWLALGALTPPPTDFLDNPLTGLDWYPRWLTTIKVAGHYLWLFVWPASLSADYSFRAIPPAVSLLDAGVISALLAWLSLLGFAIWSFRREPRAAFGIGLLAATFLPISNLVVLIGTIMGERLFYLPSAGLCLLAGLAYARVASQPSSFRLHPSSFSITRHLPLLLVVLMCLAFLARTVVRNRDWLDNEHMARSALRVVPGSAKVHSVLGRIAKDKGHWDEAIAHYQTALSIYPGYAQVDVTFNSNLGISLIEKGHVAEGIKALEGAARMDPQWSLLHYNLGFAYAKQGRDQEAEDSYRRALSLNDEDPRAYTGLGYLFLKQGRYTDALASAEAALKRDPHYAEALFVQDRARQALGHSDDACVPGFVKC